MYCSKKRKQHYKKRIEEKPLINTYESMIARCYNKNHMNYKYYGKLGIKVCKRWLDSYDNFEKDLGARPLGTTLDRISPYKDYKPSNCRWADASTQAKNKKPYGKIKERYISIREGNKNPYRVKLKKFDRQFKTLKEAKAFKKKIIEELT